MSQLASAGEEALGKLTQSPVTHKALQGALHAKDTAEKAVRALGGVEKRLEAIEKRLAALEKAKKPAPRPRTAKPKASPTKPA